MRATPDDNKRKGTLFICCCIFSFVVLAAFLPKLDIYRTKSVGPLNRIERHLPNESRSGNGTMICIEETLRKKKVSVHNRCKVQVYFTDQNTGLKTVRSSSESTSCRPRCTNRLLRHNERGRNGSSTNETGFVSSGYWEAHPINSDRCSGEKAKDEWRHRRRNSALNSSSSSRLSNFCLRRFHTDFCSFAANDDVTDVELRRCLAERRIRYVATFGDSNGNRTFQGLVDVISKAMQGGCDLIKAESKGALVDKAYFFTNGEPAAEYLQLGARHCFTCTSRRFRCRYRHFPHRDDVIELEHIAMTRAMDYTIRVLPRRNGPPGANNTIEFILRDYFKDQFPDVMVIMMPFVHEVKHRPPDGFDEALIRSDVETYFEAVLKYTPPSTQVYWLPSHYVFGRFNGLSRDCERVKAYNAILYDVIRRRLVDNHHTFLDLFHLSCPLRRLVADPVHMSSKWYRTIAGHLLQLACDDEATKINH